MESKDSLENIDNSMCQRKCELKQKLIERYKEELKSAKFINSESALEMEEIRQVCLLLFLTR